MTPTIFSIERYDYLADEMARLSGWQRGEIERRTFPDGEHYLRAVTDVTDKDVIVVGGTIDERATLELYDLASGLVTYGAYRLTLVIPYYGYSTMERAVKPGEIVTAKTRACVLSSI